MDPYLYCRWELRSRDEIIVCFAEGLIIKIPTKPKLPELPDPWPHMKLGGWPEGTLNMFVAKVRTPTPPPPVTLSYMDWGLSLGMSATPRRKRRKRLSRGMRKHIRRMKAERRQR